MKFLIKFQLRKQANTLPTAYANQVLAQRQL